jgi:hypothetical protein
MCDDPQAMSLLVKAAIPIIGWAGLYYVMSWRPRRKAQEELLLAEYNELMKKQGYIRSHIGKVPIWVPVRPMPAGFGARQDALRKAREEKEQRDDQF